MTEKWNYFNFVPDFRFYWKNTYLWKGTGWHLNFLSPSQQKIALPLQGTSFVIPRNIEPILRELVSWVSLENSIVLPSSSILWHTYHTYSHIVIPSLHCQQVRFLTMSENFYTLRFNRRSGNLGFKPFSNSLF